MNSDLLQQLRDIHLPATPGWWPPAVGWWVLAALVVVLLAWLAWWLVGRWHRFRPARTANTLYRRVADELRTGAITPMDYVHQTNELLKRLAIHDKAEPKVASASGDVWLRYLDERYGQAAFSRGVGRCLGNERFRREARVDTEALNGLIRRYLATERARFWRVGDRRGKSSAAPQ